MQMEVMEAMEEEMAERLVCVCIASSRVGATTRTEMGPLDFLYDGRERMCWIAGTPKATVFPDLREGEGEINF